eukprot:2243575-Prymnesium_polylepis.1
MVPPTPSRGFWESISATGGWCVNGEIRSELSHWSLQEIRTVISLARLDSTLLTARPARAGNAPVRSQGRTRAHSHPHNPSRPLRSP